MLTYDISYVVIRHMSKDKMDLLQGTLDMLILRLLATKRRHGYDIAKRIQTVSNNLFKIGQGSLYPALHRLEKKGYVEASWDVTQTGRRAKFYALTEAGRGRIKEERAYWRDFSEAINAILQKG